MGGRFGIVLDVAIVVLTSMAAVGILFIATAVFVIVTKDRVSVASVTTTGTTTPVTIVVGGQVGILSLVMLEMTLFVEMQVMTLFLVKMAMTRLMQVLEAILSMLVLVMT